MMCTTHATVPVLKLREVTRSRGRCSILLQAKQTVSLPARLRARSTISKWASEQRFKAVPSKPESAADAEDTTTLGLGGDWAAPPKLLPLAASVVPLLPCGRADAAFLSEEVYSSLKQVSDLLGLTSVCLALVFGAVAFLVSLLKTDINKLDVKLESRINTLDKKLDNMGDRMSSGLIVVGAITGLTLAAVLWRTFSPGG